MCGTGSKASDECGKVVRAGKERRLSSAGGFISSTHHVLNDLLTGEYSSVSSKYLHLHITPVYPPCLACLTASDLSLSPVYLPLL